MAEEQQGSTERTEQPTERRRQESRKKGQVPRSRELNTMLSLLVTAIGMLVLGDSIAAEFAFLIESTLSFDREMAYNKELLAPHFVGVVLSSILILSPFLAVTVVGAFAGPLAMGGWSFSVSAMAFKLEKLSPVKGIARVFSAKGLVELFKALFKFLVVSAISLVLFHLYLDRIINLGSMPSDLVFAEATNILRWSFLSLSFAMIFIVVFDVPFELWNHTKQLKMTLQEVKDEMKESEGRPEVKSRIRTLQREMSQRRMMDAVPDADVVITNPSHFSVALKYDNKPGVAPTVVAKGRDLIAFKIRSIAVENDVAIFAAPPLARALYASSEIGDEIPQNLYLAVAKILAYVYQINQGVSGIYTAPPTDFSIPEEYGDLQTDTGRDDNE
jgi:flagellar biosynthetic protein FlhB